MANFEVSSVPIRLGVFFYEITYKYYNCQISNILYIYITINPQPLFVIHKKDTPALNLSNFYLLVHTNDGNASQD